MPRTSHPRVVLVIAVVATIGGVVGESVSGSAMMHLISVVFVVLGLLAAVVVAPNIAGDDVEREPISRPAPPDRAPQPDRTALRDPRDPRDDAATKPAAPQPPRL